MAEILIIDDNRQMRRLIIRILQGAGHTVREAEHGRDGIAQFRKRPADLVISDMVMPDMEGIETIRELRRDKPALPIIAISGGGHPVYLRAATALGATATLDKPFSADQLVALVSALLAP